MRKIFISFFFLKKNSSDEAFCVSKKPKEIFCAKQSRFVEPQRFERELVMIDDGKVLRVETLDAIHQAVEVFTDYNHSPNHFVRISNLNLKS